MPTIWKPGSDQMAEKCGSRVAHDWRGYGAVAVSRYCCGRDAASELIKRNAIGAGLLWFFSADYHHAAVQTVGYGPILAP